MRYLSILLLMSFMTLARVPSFRAPVLIKADSKNLQVNSMADPFMVDWDGDGKNDLLVGQYIYGKIRFYKNIGTNQVPVFTFENNLKADGKVISLSFS